MFFIGIFGTKRSSREMGTIKFLCTQCIGETMKLIEIYTAFEIFFIPVFKYRKKYVLECKGCSSLYLLKNESIPHVLENKEAGYEDVDKVVFESTVCKKCHTPLLEQFKYCPKCGTKV